MIERFIVLSPGHPDRNGEFPDWGSDGTYIGGNTRMQAVTKLAGEHPDIEFWMLAGMNVEPATVRLTTPFSDKAQQMRRYVDRHNPDSEIWRRLIDVPSLPCTYHNFVALFNRMKFDGEIDEPNDITLTIITNDYHIPRSKAQMERAWYDTLLPHWEDEVKANVYSRWLGAEAILGVSLDNLSTEQQTMYDERLRREAEGLRVLQGWGEYKDSCLQYKDDEELRRRLIVGEYLDHNPSLLAPGEKERWGVWAPL